MNLVMVPGLLCDGALWAHQAQYLADITQCHVADVTADETVETMAATVLAGAPNQFALAGLSMGGYVCHAIMRQAPERVLKLVYWIRRRAAIHRNNPNDGASLFR